MKVDQKMLDELEAKAKAEIAAVDDPSVSFYPAWERGVLKKQIEAGVSRPQTTLKLIADLREVRREAEEKAERIQADAAFPVARAELFRLEWSGRMQGEPACPRCSALWKRGGKHAPDCSLARGLGLAPEEPLKRAIRAFTVDAGTPDAPKPNGTAEEASLRLSEALLALPPTVGREIWRLAEIHAGAEADRLRDLRVAAEAFFGEDFWEAADAEQETDASAGRPL